MTYTSRSAKKYCSVIDFIAINCPQSFRDGIVRELLALYSIFKVPWILFTWAVLSAPSHFYIHNISLSLASLNCSEMLSGLFCTCSLSLLHTFASQNTCSLKQHISLLPYYPAKKSLKPAPNCWNDACWYGYFPALQPHLGAQVKKLSRN